MATRAVTSVDSPADDRVMVATWLGMTEADTGAPCAMARWPDRTVQVTGTFGGGTIRIEGSNDGGVTYGVLHDPQGNNLDLTSSVPKLIAENTLLIRPRSTAGAGMNVGVYITAKMED